MTPRAHLLLVLTCLLFVSLVAMADELPADTNKIESLTPEQARKLAETFPGVIEEVRRIHASGSSVFSSADCLPLNGLKKLDADVAEALARYRKGPLILNGLTTLDAETARSLAGFQGKYLFLNGLTTLDADAAAALAEFKGRLYLDGLAMIPADAAKA